MQFMFLFLRDVVNADLEVHVIRLLEGAQTDVTMGINNQIVNKVSCITILSACSDYNKKFCERYG